MPNNNGSAVRFVHVLPLACAALVTLSGVGTLVSWHLGPGDQVLFAPTHPSTAGVVAFAFVVCGVALLVLQAGWNRFAAIMGASVAGVALLVFLQDLLGLNLGLDPAVLEGLASSRRVIWVSVSPTTLIAFVLAGGALIVLGSRASHAFAGVTLGALAATLGLVGLLETFDAGGTLGWLAYFSTSTLTAACLLVLGVGLVAAGLDRRDPESEPAAWAAPVAMGITVALVGAILWQGLRTHELDHLQRFVEARTRTFSASVQNRLSLIVAYLEGFPYQPPAAVAGVGQPVSAVRPATGYFIPGLRSTTWIDVPQVSPPTSPVEALAAVSELSFLEGSYDTLLQAEGPFLSGPTVLGDGETGLRIVLRRDLENQARALVTGVVSAASVFSTLAELDGTDVDVLILCNDVPVFQRGDIQLGAAPPFRRMPLQLPGPESWEMIVSPRIDLLEAHRSALPEVVLGASLLIAVLLTALAHTATVARHRALILEMKEEEDGARGGGGGVTPIGDEVERLVTAIGHEIRNPLATVRNVVEILKQHDGDAVDRERLRTLLDRQVKRLIAVMDALLDIRAGGRASTFIEMRSLDLTGLIRDLVHAEADEQPSASLAFRREETELIVKADRTRLQRAFRSLLEHSLRNSPPGEEVEVEVTRDSEGIAKVKVRDHGPEIGPDEIEELFFPLSAAEEASGRRATGGTLALAAARRIIEIHGGRVDVVGATPGLEFHVFLPLA